MKEQADEALIKMFQHTAARRRLARNFDASGCFFMFQHTAARRRLVYHEAIAAHLRQFQHTAARRRLAGLVESIM